MIIWIKNITCVLRIGDSRNDSHDKTVGYLEVDKWPSKYQLLLQIIPWLEVNIYCCKTRTNQYVT